MVRRVDRCGCRTVIDEGEPARVAVGEDIDGFTKRLLGSDLLNQFHTMFTDLFTCINIFIGNPFGLLTG